MRLLVQLGLELEAEGVLGSGCFCQRRFVGGEGDGASLYMISIAIGVRSKQASSHPKLCGFLQASDPCQRDSGTDLDSIASVLTRCLTSGSIQQVNGSTALATRLDQMDNRLNRIEKANRKRDCPTRTAMG